MSMSDDISVSAEEMDALMTEVKGGPERELTGDGSALDVVRYDLVAARTVGGGQLPTLDLVNERFAGLMGDALGRTTGHQARVQSSPAIPVKFVECAANLPTPACLQVLELGGLRGTAIMCFDPTLLFHVMDLLLGGTPKEVVDAAPILKRRGLTGVERRLFAHLVRTIGAELTTAWDGVTPLTIRPLRAETDSKHIALFEPGEMVVDTVFEVETAGCKGKIHFIVPQASLKPIEKQLASGLLDSGDDGQVSWRRPLTKLMHGVKVQCTAELGRTVMSLRELLSMKEGDIVRLDREPHNPITFYVEGAPKLMGVPTVTHGNIALEVCSKVTTDNKSKKTQRGEGNE